MPLQRAAAQATGDPRHLQLRGKTAIGLAATTAADASVQRAVPTGHDVTGIEARQLRAQ